MESAAKKLTMGRRQMAREKRRRTGGERRRLAQLVVSLLLFLLVFAGRGAFPARLREWKAAMAADTDFKTAFQQFGTELKSDAPFGQAVRALFASLAGQESSISEPQPTPDQPAELPEVVLLGETARGGLTWLNAHSFAGTRTVQPAQEEPEPAAEQPASMPQSVVTAVAQAYDENGVALPSNVSFQYYELGLERTAVPVRGTVTSNFEYRTSPITGKREFHLAMDIAAKEGTRIGAFSDGTVRYIGESDEFGQYLMIDHANGVSTFYAHCSKLLVRKGESVTCGQTVALVGHTGKATGSHLHLTILKDNVRLDPAYYVDPS